MIPRRHSYSSIACYIQCPARYSYRYVQHLTEPGTAAMDRGTRLHKQAETYLLSPEMPCPYELRRVGLTLYRLRQRGALSEQTWYVDADWNKCDSDAAKIKCVVDVHYVANDVLYLSDFKSGREYSTHSDQLELYSLVGLQHYPEVKRVESNAIYIDNGCEGKDRSMIRDMLPHYRKEWDRRIARIESDPEFLPAPGSHCKSCPFGKSKGGPCQAENPNV